MKEFPNKLNVKNKNNFQYQYINRVLCYLRRDIYDHIISNDESSYFDLDKFDRKYLNNINETEKITRKIIEELEVLGWTCVTSFGGTGLFIYSDKDNPPSNCWLDGL